MTLIFYLAMNAVVIHIAVLIYELVRPEWVIAKNFRAANLEEYWGYLLLIALIYRYVKGTLKKMFGVEQ